MEIKYNCKYHKKCVMPKVDYRCNTAYEHCIVYQRSRVLLRGKLEELSEKGKE